jgi:formiminoglutamate deiminase
MTEFWCEYAWVDAAPVPKVLVTCGGDGVITEVRAGVDPTGTRLRGLVFPGFANAHSHAFHRALRGRTHHAGSFWSWRDSMYRLANRLDPDSYQRLATAVFAEMVLSGYTVVGEFHYLHHQADGRPYVESNAMGLALIEAARSAGIRLTLLDACYLTGGIGKPLQPEQARFGDADSSAWAERLAALPEEPGFKVGAAIHSVRAVPADQISTVAAAADGRPLHFHLSEQPAENEQCLAAYGMSPAQLLNENGALRPPSTAVHAIHLSESDINLLGDAGSAICVCPTTERDLGDGIGPAVELASGGCLLSLGTDQHASIDPFEEMRGVELDQRLRRLSRGLFAPEDLIRQATVNGYQALGWEGGTVAVGQPCDLVAVDLDSIRTAGTDPRQAVMAAGAGDVSTVVIGGEVVVLDRSHRLGKVAQLLERAITPLWD